MLTKLLHKEKQMSEVSLIITYEFLRSTKAFYKWQSLIPQALLQFVPDQPGNGQATFVLVAFQDRECRDPG